MRARCVFACAEKKKEIRKKGVSVAYGFPDRNTWRARYKRPDGTWGSRSGFSSEKAAEDWGKEQEALIRRNLWIDPRNAETLFGEFVEDWFAAVSPRLEPSTTGKYRSVIDNHLLAQWQAWPMIGIFNSSLEIEKWVSELHEEYADSTVSTIFATFSTVMNAAVRARMIPASPCQGIRVTSGEFDVDRLVATPVQVLRAAMRLHETVGLGGFVLCLMDAYTGARWSELVGQQPHEYNAERRDIRIQNPLKEVGGKVFKSGHTADLIAERIALPARGGAGQSRRPRNKKGRTKTPAGTRLVELPPSIAVFYEELLDSHRHPFVMCTLEGRPWRRSNFRQRYWRPAWDGQNMDDPCADDHIPPILPWFTFNEGRHTHATWLAEDGVPEVARRARLGQKMKGIARVYDHVTPGMRRMVLDALEARWLGSLATLTPVEQTRLVGRFPHLRMMLDDLQIGSTRTLMSAKAPHDH
jgi:integrase